MFESLFPTALDPKILPFMKYSIYCYKWKRGRAKFEKHWECGRTFNTKDFIFSKVWWAADVNNVSNYAFDNYI